MKTHLYIFVKQTVNLVVDMDNFVETGFLQTNVTDDTLVYRNSVEARKYLPNDRGATQFLGFCDNSRYSLSDLDDYDGKPFHNTLYKIRIGILIKKISPVPYCAVSYLYAHIFIISL